VGENRSNKLQNRRSRPGTRHKVIDSLRSKIGHLLEKLDISQEPCCPLIAQRAGVNGLVNYIESTNDRAY